MKCSDIKILLKNCFELLNQHKPDITGGNDLSHQVRKLCIELNEHTKYEGGFYDWFMNIKED